MNDPIVGYNLFPIKSVVDYSYTKGAKNVKVSEIEMPFELLEKEDPLRSWTVNLEGKGRFSTNGLQFLYRIKCIEIHM